MNIKKIVILSSLFIFPIIKPSDLVDQNCQLTTKGFNKNSCSSSMCAINSTVIKKLPFTISSSGVYTLEACLSCSLCLSDGACITISASDVTLNLNGFTLSGGAIAIQINNNLQNIIIKNGTINNTQAQAIIVGQGGTNIQLIDLQILNANQCNGSAAVSFQGVAGNPITSSLIKNSIISDSKNTGISLQTTNFTKLINNTIQSILGTDSSLDTIGIMDVGGKFNTYENCNVSQVISLQPNGRAIGYSLSSVASSLQSCQATNIASMAPPNNSAFGFFVSQSQCANFVNCLSSSNNASLNQAAGMGSRAVAFLSQGSTGTNFEYCAASNILSPDFGIGFQLAADTSSLISQCTSLANSHFGYIISDATTNSALGNNKALSNGSVGFNIAQPLATGAIFYSNFAARNLTNYSANIIATYPVGALGKTPADNGDNINGA